MDCVTYLEQGCAQLGLSLKQEQFDKLCLYYQELSRWNKKMNLVAKASMAEVLSSHFLDSLTLLPHLPEGPFSLMDVGTGAGFPGLVLKVVCPQMQLILVEPRGKRVTFLRHIIRTLKLDGVQVVGERLEPDNVRQRAQLGGQEVVTSRALADLTTFVELVEPFTKAGGYIICMKGPKAEQELAAWQEGHQEARLRFVEKISCPVEPLGKDRQLLFLQKREGGTP